MFVVWFVLVIFVAFGLLVDVAGYCLLGLRGVFVDLFIFGWLLACVCLCLRFVCWCCGGDLFGCYVGINLFGLDSGVAFFGAVVVWFCVMFADVWCCCV